MNADLRAASLNLAPGDLISTLANRAREPSPPNILHMQHNKAPEINNGMQFPLS